MRKAKRFTLFVDGDQIAWVVAWMSEVDRFECILKRVCRYAAKFGYNLQYEIKDFEF